MNTFDSKNRKYYVDKSAFGEKVYKWEKSHAEFMQDVRLTSVSQSHAGHQAFVRRTHCSHMSCDIISLNIDSQLSAQGPSKIRRKMPNFDPSPFILGSQGPW